MATAYTSRDDPQRSLDLPWGAAKAPTRGPKPELRVERIVRVAAGSNLEYHMQNAVDDFAFGLQRVLDGVEVFLQRRHAEQSAR
jgi:hypothetical protein